MRITGITSRIISYDVSAIYGEVGPPAEISTAGVIIAPKTSATSVLGIAAEYRRCRPP